MGKDGGAVRVPRFLWRRAAAELLPMVCRRLHAAFEKRGNDFSEAEGYTHDDRRTTDTYISAHGRVAAPRDQRHQPITLLLALHQLPRPGSEGRGQQGDTEPARTHGCGPRAHGADDGVGRSREGGAGGEVDAPLYTNAERSERNIQSTCFTSCVTSNANPCPMITTQDSLYFLSIVSLTNLAALCAKTGHCCSAQICHRPQARCPAARGCVRAPRSCPGISQWR